MLFFALLIQVIILAVALGQTVKTNDRPIIGVFSQPSSSKEGDCNGSCMYLAASYVKYLESAGARVVPINYSATNAELDFIFSSVNGIFFPGGGSSFPKQAQYIYDKVVAANDAGDFMPLWGTCMGFQWLMIAQSRNTNILDPKSGQMDSYNVSLPLEFTAAAKSSRLFTNAGGLYDVFAKENVTMNNHHYGIYPSTLESTSSLSSFFNVLSTNHDLKGVEFVSTVEAFKYPIYGSQWHPEKNNFEYGETNGIPNEAINHSADAVAVAQYTASFFVNEARKNLHKFANYQDEEKRLIYNYKPSYTTGSFVQTYFFHF